MARRYGSFTPARRAALHRAQLASAAKRKGRGKRLSPTTRKNLRRAAIGTAVVGTAVTGAVIAGNRRSPSTSKTLVRQPAGHARGIPRSSGVRAKTPKAPRMKYRYSVHVQTQHHQSANSIGGASAIMIKRHPKTPKSINPKRRSIGSSRKAIRKRR